MFEATDLLQAMSPSYYLYNVLLSSLVVLDTGWFYYIGRAAVLAVYSGQVCKLISHWRTQLVFLMGGDALQSIIGPHCDRLLISHSELPLFLHIAMNGDFQVYFNPGWRLWGLELFCGITDPGEKMFLSNCICHTWTFW